MTDGDSGGILERLRNSPRTVSTLIVILIVVGAIFAFSDRGSRTEAPSGATGSPVSTGGEPTPEISPAATATTTPTASTTEGGVAPTPLPVAEETEAAYVEVAASGDGVTHIARRSLHRYLESAAQDFPVTVEHKVWIEDYVKDRLGRKPLALGERLTVEKELLRDAVARSKSLSDAQLKNLQRFAQRVAVYRK